MNTSSLVALQAYGTSDGLKKAWDARGRGKHTMGERDKSKVRAVKTIKLPSGATFYQGKTVGEKMLTPPSKQDLAHNQPGYAHPSGKTGTKVKLPPGRLWPEQAYWKSGVPSADKHPLRGDFRRTSADVNAISNTTFKPLPGASTTIYQARNVGSDKAATLFSSFNEKTGDGRIVEFNHDADNKLQYRKQNQQLLSSMGETQVVRFSSGTAQSNYLRQRYGIDKDFKQS